MHLATEAEIYAQPQPLRRPGFWLPCLSVLCSIHCFGIALLAPWLPSVVAAVSDTEWLEWTLAGVVALCTGWLILRTRSGSAVRSAAVLAVVVVVTGTALEAELLQQAGFLSAAILQVLLVRQLRRACKEPSCAEACGLPRGS